LFTILFFLPTISLADEIISDDKKIDEGFTIQPTYPNGIEMRVLMSEIKPGESSEDYLTIKNTGEIEQYFKLYPVEKKENNTYTGEKEELRSIGKWLSLEPSEITLKPEETAQIKVNIKIPSNTELGTYNAGISLSKFKPAANYKTITIESRVIQNVSVKVTNNPQRLITLQEYLQKQKEQKMHQANTFNSQTYFFLSIVVFIASMSYVLYATLKEKKNKTAR